MASLQDFLATRNQEPYNSMSQFALYTTADIDPEDGEWHPRLVFPTGCYLAYLNNLHQVHVN